jgi:hypothetical protein
MLFFKGIENILRKVQNERISVKNFVYPLIVTPVSPGIGADPPYRAKVSVFYKN